MCPFRRVFMSPELESSSGEGGRQVSQGLQGPSRSRVPTCTTLRKSLSSCPLEFGPVHLSFCCCVFETGFFWVSWLSWNLLYKSGWLQKQRFSCLCILSSGLKVATIAWLTYLFLFCFLGSSPCRPCRPLTAGMPTAPSSTAVSPSPPHLGTAGRGAAPKN